MELLAQLVDTKTHQNTLEKEVAHLHTEYNKTKQEKENLEYKMKKLEVYCYYHLNTFIGSNHIYIQLHMGRKQEDAYLPNIVSLYRVTSNPYCEFNFKKIFTKPSGNV